MGAWIEIFTGVAIVWIDDVAPYMGAWIEIGKIVLSIDEFVVAPYMGAWIEISYRESGNLATWSLPTWERGLKFPDNSGLRVLLAVPAFLAYIDIIWKYRYYDHR